MTNSQADVGRTATDSQTTDLDQRRAKILLSALTIYAILWVLEGAARKWVPGTSSILYFARDGILLTMVAYAAIVTPQKQRQVLGILFWGCGLLLLLFGFVQAIALDLPPAVALAGARALIAPWIPLYIILRHRPPGVWRRLAFVLLLFAPIEALLTIGQSASPPGAIINRQIGNEDAYFTTSGGVVRGTGTFSSPVGLSMFVVMCLGVALAELVRRDASKWLSAVGLVSAATILILGGSRSALLSAAIVAGVFALHQVATRGLGSAPKLIGVAGIGAAAALIVAYLYPDVVAAFSARINSASDSDNIDGRLIGTALGFFSYPVTDFGNGLGSHSQIGAALGSGQRWSEDENTRWVADLGILGYVIVIGRMLMGIALALWLLLKLRHVPAITATMGGVLVPLVLYGSLTTQPTVQGSIGITVAIMASALLEYRNLAGRPAAIAKTDASSRIPIQPSARRRSRR